MERGERGNDVGRIGERGVWVDREEKKTRGGIDPNVTTVFLTQPFVDLNENVSHCGLDLERNMKKCKPE